MEAESKVADNGTSAPDPDADALTAELGVGEILRLPEMFNPTQKDVANRVLLERVSEKIELTGEEKIEVGFTQVSPQQFNWDRTDAEDWTKTVTFSPMEWRFVRIQLRDVIRSIKADGQRQQRLPDNRLNDAFTWGIFDAFGLLEEALDACEDAERVPSGPFIMEYLEKAGRLEGLDLD